MRKSVIKGDPGYDLEAFNYQVYLDGVAVDDCHTADEEKGVCYCHARDENNNFIIEGDTIKTIERHGIVKIEKLGNAHIH